MADQEKATLYSQLVKQIVEIEGSSEKPESGSVNISESFSGSTQRGNVDYSNLINLISEVERKESIFQRPQKLQPQIVEQVAQPSAEEQPQIVEQVAQPSAEEQVIVSAEALAIASAKKQVKKELAELTKALPIKMPMFEEQKIKKVNSDLVLPNLSLLDQVSELERIIEGLRANIFMGDEREIVEEELYGLAEQVKKEKSELKKRKTLQQDAAQLWSLRDQRLTVAIVLLQQRRNG